MQVRWGTRDDAETLVGGNRAMARETEEVTLDVDRARSGVKGLFDDVRRGRYVIAEHEGSVAGQLMITYEWSDWRNADVWWIQSVYVWPEHRRRGVYRALYAFVLEAARSAGAAGVRLYVDRRNTRAQATYAALGMDGEHYQVFEQLF